MTKSQRKKIAAMYVDGTSAEAIASELGLELEAVQSAIARTPPEADDPDAESRGLTPEQIAILRRARSESLARARGNVRIYGHGCASISGVSKRRVGM